MKRKLQLPILLTSLIGIHSLVVAQRSVSIKIEPGEYWYGGLTGESHHMPYENGYHIDQIEEHSGNQSQPLLLSSQGRYVWCDDPISYSFKNDSLLVSSRFSEINSGKVGSSLKEAYRYVSSTYFPFKGKIPDELLFTAPQYNTWIELIYNQNEKDILAYAKSIIDFGFPPGVLMIDDNWQENYGVWEFKAEKFNNPKAMINQLHVWGFKVMLWVCPFVSPDSENFRKLRGDSILLKNANDNDQPAIIRWWNGYSAHLDFTNPDAVKWFKGQLNYLQETYGVDGFKLDAGDLHHYTPYNLNTFQPILHANELSTAYAKIGLDYALNEYRACWKMGGEALAQRLKDKNFSWEDLQLLIPGMTTQGILGYPFACPDLIGGGEYKSFLRLDGIDQERIVRAAQIHALMPMMQFSLAPWRVLDEEHLGACKKAALLHSQFGDKIIELAKQSAKTGEPIVRSMEYEFPDQHFATVKDQFMLGPDILVTPVTRKGQWSRTIKLPKGKWEDELGKKYAGGRSVTINVPLDRLPYFISVK